MRLYLKGCKYMEIKLFFIYFKFYICICKKEFSKYYYLLFIFINEYIYFIIEEYKYVYMLRKEDGIFCLVIC